MRSCCSLTTNMPAMPDIQEQEILVRQELETPHREYSLCRFQRIEKEGLCQIRGKDV